MDAPQIEIRPATAADAARLALVAQATFLETFAGVLDGDDILAHCAAQHGADHYAHLLAATDARAWLAETRPGRAPIGYLTAGDCALPLPDVSAADFEIKRIYVLQRFHGARVGAGLMRLAVDEARAAGKRRILLGVYAHNERALAFYDKLGFRRVGERRFTVGANRYDDILLARALEPADDEPWRRSER